MPNYLHTAGGDLNSSFPWSITMVSASSGSEAAANTAWANGWTAAWGVTAFAALFPTTTNLNYASTSTASADFKQTTKTVQTLNLVGTGTTSLPYQVAEVVTWRTASATKWGRGRWYLPAMDTTVLATGGFLLSTAAQTAIVDGLNAALTAWVGELTFQVLHRKATLSGPGADTLTTITGGDVANKFVIQRRRADKLVPARMDLTF